MARDDLYVRHDVEPAHFGGEKSLRRHQFEPCAAVGDELGRRHAGMGAVVVEYDHLFGGLYIAGENLPTRYCQFGAIFDRHVLRQAAGRDDDDIGVKRSNVRAFRESVELHLNAEALALLGAPVGDADQLAPALDLGGDTDLPAGVG